MKIDRREFLKAVAVMGMNIPMTQAYGSVSQRHVHRGSDACTPDVKYLHVSLKEVPLPKNISFSVHHAGKTVTLGAGDELFEEKQVEGVIPRIWV